MNSRAGTVMNDYDFNPGILIGGAAAAISVLAAIAALYLWAVNRARQRLSTTATPQERAVVPWLQPLVLPVLLTLCLGLIANLAKAYQHKTWPDAAFIFITCMLLLFWLRLRKKIKLVNKLE
jgi:hypothetical protein